jgi:DnaJ-class molecular chaperone
VTLEPAEYVFKCPECDGDGSVWVITNEPCHVCNGEGFVDMLIAEGENETVRETCPECDGVGSPKVSMICQDCYGTAEISVDEEEAAAHFVAGDTLLRILRLGP